MLHIQHCSVEKDSLLRPELPGNAFKDVAIPESGEPLVKKSTASAFVGTNLEELLHSLEISSLVIAGLTTDHCVSASARSASDLGFEVIVVSDATAAHEKKAWDGNSYSAENVHTLSLVALDGEFSDIRSTDEILASTFGQEKEPTCRQANLDGRINEGMNLLLHLSIFLREITLFSGR